MAIGRRVNAPAITTGGPGVHGAAEVEVEVGPDVGRSRLIDQLVDELPDDLSGETMDDLISASRAAKEFVEIIEAVRKRIGGELMSRMCLEGETEHPTSDGQWVCQLLVGRTGAKLSETRLLEAGVSADVIANSREGGKEYSYVQIKRSTSTK